MNRPKHNKIRPRGPTLNHIDLGSIVGLGLDKTALLADAACTNSRRCGALRARIRPMTRNDSRNDWTQAVAVPGRVVLNR